MIAKYKIIGLLLIIIGSLIFHMANSIEGMSEKRIDVGNYISDYYFQYVCSILEEKNFRYNSAFGENSVYSFIQYFPNDIVFDKSIHDNFSKNGINMDHLKQNKDFSNASFWIINQEKQITLTNIMKPHMHAIIDNALKQEGLHKNVGVPVIHFRCADTPFIRSEHYHFQKYKFFTEILNKYSYSEIIILSYTKHKTGDKEQKSCDEYANALKTHLEEKGYKVTIKSDNLGDDFATIFYSPLIISTSSSFSAMAGLFSDGAYYQTCPTDIKNDANARIFMYPKEYNLEHENVPDYYDVPNVIKLLKS